MQLQVWEEEEEDGVWSHQGRRCLSRWEWGLLLVRGADHLGCQGLAMLLFWVILGISLAGSTVSGLGRERLVHNSSVARGFLGRGWSNQVSWRLYSNT